MNRNRKACASKSLGRFIALLLVTGAVSYPAHAQTHPTTNPLPTPITMNLWPGAAPNAVVNAKPERDDGTGRIWNVSIPGMLVYLPPKDEQFGSRIALIECPGGHYTHLTRLVGADGAVETFLPKGVVVIALKYRLTPPSTVAGVAADALADGARAVRLVRLHAAEWGIDPHRIGLMGGSAGGHLGLNLATHFDTGNPSATAAVDRQSCRPDFVVLLSPFPNGQTISAFPVSADSPPAYICSAKDDTTAPVEFAQDIAAAYDKAGAQEALWIIPTGGHGAFTIGGPGEGGHWPQHFWPWLVAHHFYAK